MQAGLGGSPRCGPGHQPGRHDQLPGGGPARGAAFLFLSTSRVYPIAALNGLPFSEDRDAVPLGRTAGHRRILGARHRRGFPARRGRSFYGASKLACEQLIQEYVYSYGHAGA